MQEIETTIGKSDLRGVPDRLAVIVTCFNRREKTLECLRRLYAFPEAERLDVYLLDDGSRDGTGSAVREQFPTVKVYDGDGSYFWSGGMRFLFEKALSVGYDGYLWLNDDNELSPDALGRMLHWMEQTGGQALLGGAMTEADGQTIAYGGNDRYSIHPMRFRRVEPDDVEPKPVDCLNGNFLLIPSAVAAKVGNIPPGLVQQGADFVYSVRAHKAGFKVLLLPGSYGTCPTNDFGKPKRGLDGIRKILSPRHLPLRPSIAFYKEMAGPTWPFWLAVLYTKAFVQGY